MVSFSERPHCYFTVDSMEGKGEEIATSRIQERRHSGGTTGQCTHHAPVSGRHAGCQVGELVVGCEGGRILVDDGTCQ